MACCALHNFLRTNVFGRAMYTPAEFIDVEDEVGGHVQEGRWRQEGANGMVNFVNQGGNRHANAALFLRDRWCEYFNGPGAVPWQNQFVQ